MEEEVEEEMHVIPKLRKSKRVASKPDRNGKAKAIYRKLQRRRVFPKLMIYLG